MASKARARLSGRFPAGTKVGLYRAHGDTLPRDEQFGAAIKTATVEEDGTVEFTGLDDDERLFIGGMVEENRPGVPAERNWRWVVIHASTPRTEERLSDAEVHERLKQTISPHELLPDRTSVGAKGTRSTAAGGQPFANTQVGKPLDEVPSEPVPHLRQEDARDVEQRSATFTGTATPVDPDEQVPKPKQTDDDLEQRSATPRGELTPIPEGEVTPGVPQSLDADVEQRVAGETGTRFPVPQGDPVDIQRRKDSSEAKAEGAVVPPVGVPSVTGARGTASVDDMTVEELRAELRAAGESPGGKKKPQLKAAVTRSRNQ